MKRNNVAKTFGIASLCLATAISAFSGIASFANDNVALAEDATVAAETFVTVSEGATAAQGASTVSSYTYTGLRISSSTTYSAELNTVFSGDTTFKFRFPEYKSSKIVGDFKFRITDVNDDSNYFDLVYYVVQSASSRAANITGLYALYGNEIRTLNTAKNVMYNEKLTGGSANDYKGVAPYFNSLGGAYGSSTECKFREGVLSLTWTDDVLSVKAPNGERYATTRTIAQFDGTYDATAENNGFVAGSAWGLPKFSFPSGYKVSISSNYSTGTDVLFTSITTGGVTYNFSQATVTKNNNMQAYDTITDSANVGKTLLGWKDTDGALHSTATALASADFATYEPVFLGFDKIYGASVRIDTSEGGQSGLRFITGFNVEDYAALFEAGYIKSATNETGCITFGTLLAYTDSLTEGVFDNVNYADALTAGTKVTQVESTKKTFAYTHQGVTYTAYSVALVGLTDYAQSYSARGYIVVTYAGDEGTATFYTPYIADEDSRSIQQTAYNIIIDGAAEFEGYSGKQKNIVGNYANGYKGYVYTPVEE